MTIAEICKKFHCYNPTITSRIIIILERSKNYYDKEIVCTNEPFNKVVVGHTVLRSLVRDGLHFVDNRQQFIT